MEASVIRELAKENLDEQGQEQIEELLEQDEADRASNFLLGAIDARFDDGRISFEQAAEYYKKLEVPSERAIRLRQAHALRGERGQ